MTERSPRVTKENRSETERIPFSSVEGPRDSEGHIDLLRELTVRTKVRYFTLIEDRRRQVLTLLLVTL